MITDDEAFRHLPAANEFREAVADRDPDFMHACFVHTDPKILAVWCAEMWEQESQMVAALDAELLAVRDELTGRRVKVKRELADAYQRERAQRIRLEQKVTELREILNARASRKLAA